MALVEQLQLQQQQFFMSARQEKEKEKEKKDKAKKTEKRALLLAKFMLHDNIIKEIQKNYNLINNIYKITIKDKIIDLTITELIELFDKEKKPLNNETIEQVNFYLLDIYYTTASKAIAHAKKEFEAIQQEKQQEELQNYILEFEEENTLKETRAERRARRKEKKAQIFSLIIDVLISLLSLGIFAILFYFFHLLSKM